MWTESRFTHAGRLYRIEDAILEPKPVRSPWPPIYAGGESDAAKNLIARLGDAYVMHGDPPETIARKIADMRERRERLAPEAPPLLLGRSGVVVWRRTEESADRKGGGTTDGRAS